MMSMSGLVLGGGQGSNVPLSIAGGPALYLDASVPTTVSIDVGVDQWTDLSGNGNHVTNATDANQPAYSVPVISFDGVNDGLAAANAASLENLFAGGGYICWVGSLPSDAANGKIFTHRTAGGLGWDLQTNSTTTSGAKLDLVRLFDGANGGWTTDDRVFDDTAFAIYELAYNSDSVANDATFSKNGVAVASTETSTPTGTADDDTGGALRIAQSNVPSLWLKSDWKAALLYASIPTAVETAALRRYLGNKFGIATS